MFSEITNWYSIMTIGQIIWIIATVVNFVANTKTSDRTLKVYQTVGSITWIVHFFLIWAIEWAIANIIWALKAYFSIDRNKLAFGILTVIYLGLIANILYSGEDLWRILCYLWWFTSLIWMYLLYWVQFRILLLIDAFLWCSYNIYVMSIWWIITEVIGFLTIFFVLIFHRKKLEEENKS